MARDMPFNINVYLSPEFRPIYELLDGIAARDRIPMSTLVKKALTEWTVEHGDLDPSYVIKKSHDDGARSEVGKKAPCRFRLMTSPTTIVCKARAPTREQKPLSACIDCEDYQHDPLR